jgi:hypothetical protein
LDRELQEYYEERFSTMSSKGWKDLIEDVEKMYEATNQISSTDNFEGFHKRKGQLDILQWLLSLQQVSEQAYEELQDADNA